MATLLCIISLLYCNVISYCYYFAWFQMEFVTILRCVYFLLCTVVARCRHTQSSSSLSNNPDISTVVSNYIFC